MLLNDQHTDWNESDNDTRPAIATLHTDGNGYWNTIAKDVQITALTVPYINEEQSFGELHVHFNTDSWLPSKDGLIYTDRLFEAELQAYLNSIGLDGGDVGYSEQGMQGDNYVSCDVGEEFIASWKAKYPEAYKEAYNSIWAE
jgi:hypothetical protein